MPNRIRGSAGKTMGSRASLRPKAGASVSSGGGTRRLLMVGTKLARRAARFTPVGGLVEAAETAIGVGQSLRGKGKAKAATSPRRREKKAVIGKNIPSHRMVTRLRRNISKQKKDITTLARLYGVPMGKGRGRARGYRGYRQKRRSRK